MRGFLSGVISKQIGIEVDSAKREDGERVYRISRHFTAVPLSWAAVARLATAALLSSESLAVRSCSSCSTYPAAWSIPPVVSNVPAADKANAAGL